MGDKVENTIPWPAFMVDAGKLFPIITCQLGAEPNQPVSHRLYERAYTIEQYIEKARQDGMIKRYVYKHPDTGEPMAYGYNREDVMRLIGLASGA